MTKKEILEGNKLIAEFMFTNNGKDYENPLGTYNSCDKSNNKIRVELDNDDLDELEYHSSWDWLMPVVEKIEKLGYKVTIENNNCLIKGIAIKSKKVRETYHACSFYFDTKIEATWTAVVEFIKWYNHNKLADKVFKKRTYRSRKNCVRYLSDNTCKIDRFMCGGVNCGYYKEK